MPHDKAMCMRHRLYLTLPRWCLLNAKCPLSCKLSLEEPSSATSHPPLAVHTVVYLVLSHILGIFCCTLIKLIPWQECEQVAPVAPGFSLGLLSSISAVFWSRLSANNVSAYAKQVFMVHTVDGRARALLRGVLHRSSVRSVRERQ